MQDIEKPNLKKVTVVVPAYNRANSIRRCVESIMSQTYKNLQIVLIDDGSTDQTLKECESLSLEDDRIVVCHQSNKGVSCARNKGIEIATGYFTMFADSDDWLRPDCIETCVDDYKPNVLNAFGYYLDRDSGNSDRINMKSCGVKDNIFFGVSDIPALYKRGVFNPVWNKIYETWIIKQNKVLFDTECSIGEDGIFNLKYLSCIDPFISFNNTPLYHYHEYNSGSLSNAYHPNLICDQLHMFSEFKKYLAMQGASAKTDKQMNSIIISDMIATLDRIVMNGSYSNLKKKEFLKSDIKRMEESIGRHNIQESYIIAKIRWKLTKNGLYRADYFMRNLVKKLINQGQK